MKRIWLAGLLSIIAPLAAAQSEPGEEERYAVGQTLDPIELADQHGQVRKIDAARRALLFTRDMAAGDVLRDALAADGAARLDAASAAYVADVSAMPALVLRMFALRKMRERPYPMLLDRDGSKTARLPAEAGKVTYLVLDSLRIVGLRYLGSADEVRAALPPAGS